jgi:2-polyprenyl-3-methyl-5-hydroxy-6-metoxy-1,4-benzoquinol methylase
MSSPPSASKPAADGDLAQNSGAHNVPEYGWARSAPPHTANYLSSAINESLSDVKPETRILDIGCGNGFFIGPVSTKCSVTGIDPSVEGIDYARSAYPDGRWERLAAVPEILDLLETDPFDYVVSVEVIEHVYLPRLWAQACYNALRPGGKLICTTPYHGYLKNLTLSLTNAWDAHIDPLWDGGHIKFWSRKTLSRLLTEAGFTDIGFSGRGRLPWLWKSMVLTARKPS